jgi:rhodanese-related sulfurtransferase
MSYLRRRRPQLLDQPARAGSVATVTEEQAHAAPAMDVETARKWMTETQPLVVDLRGTFAFATAHIEGSVNIVDDLFDDLLRGGLPVDTRRPVLLACPVGEKSRRYAALLSRMGHADARSLDGGVVAWRDAGAPLVRL